MGKRDVRRRFDLLSRRDLGKYLKFYRRRAAVPAKSAAERIGRPTQVLYNIESGRAKIRDAELFELLEMYGIALDDAFTEDFAEIQEGSQAVIRGMGRYRLNKICEIYMRLPDVAQRNLYSMTQYAAAYYGLIDGHDAEDTPEK